MVSVGCGCKFLLSPITSSFIQSVRNSSRDNCDCKMASLAVKQAAVLGNSLAPCCACCCRYSQKLCSSLTCLSSSTVCFFKDRVINPGAPLFNVSFICFGLSYKPLPSHKRLRISSPAIVNAFISIFFVVYYLNRP